jgi:hypothetical protein
MHSVNDHAISEARHVSQAANLAVYTNSAPIADIAGDPNDRGLATSILKAMHQLQETFDAAALAGLIVEPSFKMVPNRFRDRGNDAESFVAGVEVYRKLA